MTRTEVVENLEVVFEEKETNGVIYAKGNVQIYLNEGGYEVYFKPMGISHYYDYPALPSAKTMNLWKRVIKDRPLYVDLMADDWIRANLVEDFETTGLRNLLYG